MRPPSPRASAGQARRAAAGQARFIVLTGLSGSGKSQAIRALEDLGYFCVDNIPTTLIPTLAELVRREGIARVAIVVDIREKNFVRRVPESVTEAAEMTGLQPGPVFLEATHATLGAASARNENRRILCPRFPARRDQTERRRMNASARWPDQSSTRGP